MKLAPVIQPKSAGTSPKTVAPPSTNAEKDRQAYIRLSATEQASLREYAMLAVIRMSTDGVLPPASVCTMHVILMHLNHESGRAWPMQETMAKITGHKKNTITKAIKKMGDLGVIHVLKPGGRHATNRYVLAADYPGIAEARQAVLDVRTRWSVDGRPATSDQPDEYSTSSGASTRGVVVEFGSGVRKAALTFQGTSQETSQTTAGREADMEVVGFSVQDEASIINAWDRMAPPNGLECITVPLSKVTRGHLAALRSKHTLAEILDVIAKIPSNPFYIGENNKNWKVPFSYFVRPDKSADIFRRLSPSPRSGARKDPMQDGENRAKLAAMLRERMPPEMFDNGDWRSVMREYFFTVGRPRKSWPTEHLGPAPGQANSLVSPAAQEAFGFVPQ